MTTYDAGAFQDFEHSGWNDVADVYAELGDGFGLTVGPAGAAILDAADVRQGRDVLDVATGPGHLEATNSSRCYSGRSPLTSPPTRTCPPVQTCSATPTQTSPNRT